MKKTLAKPMPEDEENGSKTKKEKTCQIPILGIQQVSILRTKKTCRIPTLGIQQVSISNSTMNPFDSRTMNSFDLKEIR
ncbi:MAG: hypothetical protein PUC75_02435 [Lachnospiraceae bacterium]|nr:hypothetical protein [Lachnospiraceae bacterium]